MTLSVNDAKIIIGMAARGDKLQDVAAWFGENPARVDEALKGQYGTSEAAPAANLPPKGAPGPKGRRLKGGVVKAIALLEANKYDDALTVLKDALANYNKNE